ncbi:SpoIID/LytB domain-containing protein [Longimicrobium terrae]|uniref:SpoIID/LytB domain protein n=1 Tax=Longimicrobium terrae TaxID=1639882 RepID=A0A841GYN1_9BACT|nr:SpoIID/LytB domain protein [Longimicrobium terrae]MBB6070862.1 SpoIID/LytB domain protein [Longimicrobium terrae]NNC28887.1 SpoIID/LytB domain-containing protein [Longimicrobium terrae]
MSAIRNKLRILPALVLAAALAACADDGPLGPSAAPLEGNARDVSATAFNGSIRIGVVPAAASVTLGSAADWTLTDLTANTTLLSGTGGVQATVTLETGSVSTSVYRLQVMCGSTSAVESRAAAAQALGHPTMLEPVPAAGCTRLYIGEFAPPPASNFAARTAYKNQLVAQNLAAADAFWKVVTVTTGVTRYRVQTSAGTVTSTGPVRLTSSDERVTINGAAYRGTAEVRLNSAGTLAGINQLPLEQYLYGVLPYELSPALWPELEAQKAQAVAARTYALSGLGKRSSDGYDLLATTADQVYGGVAGEHPLSNQAVDETAGIVAAYGGKLIQALFHSTSGGWTANNEDVYNSAALPYLRGVIDHERGNAQTVLDSLRNPVNPFRLRGKRNGDYEADWARYHRWTFEWSAAEISRVISDYAGQPVGRVLAINVTERSNSGRVLRIEYVTDAGTFVDTKDHVRGSLRYINASGAPTNLLSTLFVIDPVINRKTGEVTGFEAYGGGFGHGVGLSQTGAVGMAAKGDGYEAILHHYYQGIDLVRWY